MTAAPPKARPIRRRSRAVIFCAALAIAGCRSGTADGADACDGVPCPPEVTLTGRLHAVWNGTAHWFLVDGAGRDHGLAIAADVADRERLESLDRSLVTVMGVRLADGTVAVRTIVPDSAGAP